MKNIETEIIINATPEKVWQILMDHKEYRNWNPFIKEISGDTQPEKHLSVCIQLAGKKPMEFSPVVLINSTETEFRWKGHLFVKGLFDGEHYFKLEDIGLNQTKFIHGENFSGLVSGVLLKMIGDDTLNGFQSMNEALKIEAEKHTIIRKS